MTKKDPMEDALQRLHDVAEAARAAVAHHANTKAPPFTAEQLDLVVECRNLGATWHLIADALGRARSNVIASFGPFIVSEYRVRTTDDA